ncbi:MAG: hypothetical protein ACPGR7_09840 [Flavobacteriaceae bacterium]
MKRFGGSAVIIGGGKASDSKLPENQEFDNLLLNYSTELSPQLNYISSYDALVQHMGSYELLPKTAVKLGCLKHRFNEFSMRDTVMAETNIYIYANSYPNVIGVIISTNAPSLKCFFDDYKPNGYDYVLDLWFNAPPEPIYQIKEHPDHLEIILLILIYKMGLIYEGDVQEFIPSKTYLGKKFNSDFCRRLKTKLEDIETDQQMVDLLKKEGYEIYRS